MVVCQVAANAAAENDPFEMVLHDAMHCNEMPKMDLNVEDKYSPMFSKLDKNRIRKSTSLPDLRHSITEEPPRAQVTENIGGECVEPKQLSQEIFASPRVFSRNDYSQNDIGENNDIEWNYLDDIPPPDSLLNSTVDMSVLDETLSASNSSKPRKHLENQHICTNILGSQEPLKTSVKSEEAIILLAKKKIENIITKATLAVNNNIQDSIIQRRLSSQLLTPYQEALSFCTPKRSKDTHSRSSMEPSLSVQEWSRNEMLKLDIVLPEPLKKSSVGQGRAVFVLQLAKLLLHFLFYFVKYVLFFFTVSDLQSDIDKICNSFLHEANISSEVCT